MNTELIMLAGAIAVLAVVILVQAAAGVKANGLVVMAGNRDSLPPDSAFCARAKRAVQNHIEGMVMFAPLILIAAVSDISNQWTVLGSQLFLVGRAAHGAVYLIGVPWLRTLAWAVGFAGTVIVFLALFGLLA